MLHPFIKLSFITLLLVIFSSVQADQYRADNHRLVSTDTNYYAIGENLDFYTETENKITISDALKLHAEGKFSAWQKPVLSLGIGTRPQWVTFTVRNKNEVENLRRLIIETSWTDRIEIYILRNGQVIDRQHSGDLFKFEERAIDHRFFAFDHSYQPGDSQVFIRVETPDPMVLPMLFGEGQFSIDKNSSDNFSYGLLYGAICALMIYNLLLYIIISQPRYLYYVTFLLAFVIMNMSYTGHGYMWLWSESVFLQKWINPISITLFASSGIFFAFSFLNIKQLFPSLYDKTIVFMILFWGLQSIFMMADMQAAAVSTAIAFVMFFSLFTLYSAVISIKKGHREAIYYLMATITTLVGASTTALAVYSFIPYTTLTYRAAEIAISIDALLLSIALAEQIRLANKERTKALQLARIDLLTGLNNRRSFSEISAPLWHTAKRYEQSLCLILLDIDNFKAINDSHGHAAGDAVLKEVARVLDNTIRSGDVLARWGGEEFSILLPQTSLHQATQLAERIRSRISVLEVTFDTSTLSTSVSIGVASRDRNTKNIEELFKLADSELYHAKQSGKNKVSSSLKLRAVD